VVGAKKSRYVKLSGYDRKVFVEALLAPNRPHERLRQAARRYKSITGNSSVISTNNIGSRLTFRRTSQRDWCA
jgi:hypothetical protein